MEQSPEPQPTEGLPPIEGYIDRMRGWVADHDSGNHRHLGPMGAWIFKRREEELPPELAQDIITRATDPWCQAQLVHVGRVPWNDN